jgi:hypothetical protein
LTNERRKIETDLWIERLWRLRAEERVGEEMHFSAAKAGPYILYNESYF